MNKTCTQCSAPFEVTNDDLQFYEQISPVFDGKKYGIPPPKQCPDCRMRTRMAWCNERFLYHNTCAKTGKPIISEIHADNPIKVWNFHDWWSDAFSALDYGREIDWNRPILEQLHELRLTTPHPCVLTDSENENSEYTHHAGHEKNCYLMFHTSFAEDCMYGYGVKKAKSCVDNYYCHGSELCYECIDVKECYDLKWSQDCINCSTSAFLRDCIGCQDCLLCVGLRNKKHCILNEQLTKEEYEKRKAEINFGSYAQLMTLKKTFADIQLKHPFECIRTEMVENCVGSNLYRAKDCYWCFDASDIEGCKYCVQLQLDAKFCHDIYQFGIGIELCYNSTMIGYQIYNCAFCYDLLENCNNLFYCISSFASKNSIACFGLRHHEHCILNKQYTQEEYEELAPKVIEKMQADGEWGEGFPIHMSQAAYNESSAELWYPRTKEQIEREGLRWQEHDEEQQYMGPPIDLPDDITDTDESICEKILICETSGKPYKIIPQELKYYKEHGIPLPRRAFHQRHKDRFSLRNPRKFWKRQCQKCDTEIQSTYNPERPEIVYCEECYLQATYT